MADCVGCGYCCIKVVCFVAQRLHGSGLTECPYLEWNGKRYACTLVMGEGTITATYRKELSIGAGCCSSLNSWRRSVVPRRGKDLPTYKPVEIPKELQVFARALAGQFISSDAIHMTLISFTARLISEEGWSEEQAVDCSNRLRAYLREQRHSYEDDMMGSL